MAEVRTSWAAPRGSEPRLDHVSESRCRAGLQESASWELGPVDRDFVKGRAPLLVELLVLVPGSLDPARFADALRDALVGNACVAGRRSGTSIFAAKDSGVRLSVGRARDRILAARPAPRCLFAQPSRNAEGA